MITSADDRLTANGYPLLMEFNDTDDHDDWEDWTAARWTPQTGWIPA